MDLSQRLHILLQEKAAQNEFSGVVRLTRGDGSELFANPYGYANRSWHVANTVDTRFEIASMTKLFTAVAILQLIGQGKLSFDTPVIPYLGIDNTAISHDVALFHLLTHTSGIADDAEEEAGEDYADIWVNIPNYSATKTTDFLPNFIHKTANFLPGEGVRYNNVGFILLGLMLEKATNLSYRQYVQHHIFDAIGMERSGFFHMADVHEHTAESYSPLVKKNGALVGWRRAIYSRPPIGSPDGGAYTTAGDMARFWEGVWNGRLLTPELTQAFLTPQIFYKENDGFHFHYGYAVYFCLNAAGNTQFYLGQGEDNGVSSKSIYFPKHDVLAVMLANQDFCTWPIVWEVYKLLNG